MNIKSIFFIILFAGVLGANLCGIVDDSIETRVVIRSNELISDQAYIDGYSVVDGTSAEANLVEGGFQVIPIAVGAPRIVHEARVLYEITGLPFSSSFSPPRSDGTCSPLDEDMFE